MIRRVGSGNIKRMMLIMKEIGRKIGIRGKGCWLLKIQCIKDSFIWEKDRDGEDRLLRRKIVGMKENFKRIP